MSRTPYEPPSPARHRPKQARPSREVNPHDLHLIGGPALYTLVLDCGTAEPAYIIRIPADLARSLRDKLNNKHIGETVV